MGLGLVLINSVYDLWAEKMIRRDALQHDKTDYTHVYVYLGSKFVLLMRG